MAGVGEHTVAGSTLLEKRSVALGVVDHTSRAVNGTDAAWSAGSPEVTGRGAPSASSKSTSLGGGVGCAFNGLKFGGGSNSPQLRVPASASGQGTVAVGSPSPRAIGGHLNSLRRAHPEAKRESSEVELRATSSRPALTNAPAGIMKRKRPPALSISNDICTHSAGMTMTLATERDLRDAGAAEEVVVVEGQTYALSSKRGKRRLSCEDAYQAAPGLDGDPTQGIFSVFDGHGGRAAADFAAEHLHDAILREVNGVSKSPQRGAGEDGMEREDPELVEEVKAAMIRGFLATDKRFLSECHLKGGATATTAFLCAGRIWVANVGDCRAVMCEGGEAVALTHDHRPDRAEERRAVERRGGEVVSILGTSRVQGVLGVSRALGDRDLKQYITAEPEVYSGLISDRSEFLILGTDGLWDVVGNQEATALVRACLQAGVQQQKGCLNGYSVDKETNNAGGEVRSALLMPMEVAPCSGVDQLRSPKSHQGNVGILCGDVAEVAAAVVGGSGRKGTDAACRGLVELARGRGSRDDISVLIVELRSYAQGATPSSFDDNNAAATAARGVDNDAAATAARGVDKTSSPLSSSGSPRMRTPPEASPS